MKKWLSLGLLISFFMIAFLDDADAQRRKKPKKKKSTTDEYFDDSGSLASRLWYGSDIIFAFNSQAFNIGLTPMVGFKIIDPISVGPRAKVDYFYEKYRSTSGGSINLATTSWGVGLFMRGKVFNNVFAHIEYEYEDRGVPDESLGVGNWQRDPSDPNKILTTRLKQDNFYIGAGYSEGEIWKIEGVLLYNVLEPSNSYRIPLSFRLGVTYNF